VGSRAGLDNVEKIRFSTLPRLELRRVQQDDSVYAAVYSTRYV
jgi:hypothetical protein